MKSTLLYCLTTCLVLFCLSCDQVNEATSQVTDEIKTATTTKKKIILAIDGGGIKGVIPAWLIDQIEIAAGAKSHQLFDVIGGTSTGGILSIGLTTPDASDPDNSPRSASQLLSIYENDCGQIFYPNPQKDTVFGHSTGIAYGPSFYADYKNHGVEAYLKNMLGDTLSMNNTATYMIGQPNNRVKQVFTTSYQINSSGGILQDPNMGQDFGPYLFNWQDALSRPQFSNYYLWEAARGTSAAPGYFPIAHVGGKKGGRSAGPERWVIDGGVVSNDPAMWAVSEAIRTGIVSSLDELLVISIGCGLDKFKAGLGVTNESENTQLGQTWGFWSDKTWANPTMYNLAGESSLYAGMPILNTALYANQFTPENQLNMLASISKGIEYHRLQMPLPLELTNMADCSIASKLKTAVNSYFTGTGKGVAKLQTVISAVKANQ